MVHIQWTVRRKPVRTVRNPKKVMCSLPIGRMWSVRAFNPPFLWIHWPASLVITELVASIISGIDRGCPTFALSAAIAAAIVMKQIILPQVILLCLKRIFPMFSTTMWEFAAIGTETWLKVRGWMSSSSWDIRFIMAKTWFKDELGKIFLVFSPSLMSFSLMNWEQTQWIWNNEIIKNIINLAEGWTNLWCNS